MQWLKRLKVNKNLPKNFVKKFTKNLSKSLSKKNCQKNCQKKILSKKIVKKKLEKFIKRNGPWGKSPPFCCQSGFLEASLVRKGTASFKKCYFFFCQISLFHTKKFPWFPYWKTSLTLIFCQMMVELCPFITSCFWGPAHWLYCKDHKTASDSLSN